MTVQEDRQLVLVFEADIRLAVAKDSQMYYNLSAQDAVSFSDYLESVLVHDYCL